MGYDLSCSATTERFGELVEAFPTANRRNADNERSQLQKRDATDDIANALENLLPTGGKRCMLNIGFYVCFGFPMWIKYS